MACRCRKRFALNFKTEKTLYSAIELYWSHLQTSLFRRSRICWSRQSIHATSIRRMGRRSLYDDTAKVSKESPKLREKTSGNPSSADSFVRIVRRFARCLFRYPPTLWSVQGFSCELLRCVSWSSSSTELVGTTTWRPQRRTWSSLVNYVDMR